MNPFDLRGPEFLLSYAVLAAAVILLQRWLQDLVDPPSETPPHLTDPYRIAYLRGGGHEALRVAVISLLDRGLLQTRQDGKLETAGSAAAGHPLERNVLGFFENAREPASLLDRADLADGDRAPLAAMGLLADGRVRGARAKLALAAAALLVGVAVAKIAIALSRGRSNVGLLLLETVVALVFVVWVIFRRTTRRGRDALAGLRQLFAGLEARSALIERRRDSNDAAYLAAVFGMAALAAAPAYDFVRRMFPKAVAPTSWDSSGSPSCGSSTFGSSSCSSSSCGSSCGGGGCGGGCGGCGS